MDHEVRDPLNDASWSTDICKNWTDKERSLSGECRSLESYGTFFFLNQTPPLNDRSLSIQFLQVSMDPDASLSGSLA